MASRQIVLVSTAGISVHNAGIFWREAKTKRLFSQCTHILAIAEGGGSKYIQLLYVHSQNTEYRIQNTETHAHKITNVPIFLTFYMALGLNDFNAGKSITRAIGRMGP